MLSEQRICFIGGGSMAEAMLKGILAKRMVATRRMAVVDSREERRQLLSENYGVVAAAPAEAEPLVRAANVIVLAVKPQQLAAAMESYQQFLREGQSLVSILAGVNLTLLRTKVPHGVAIVRAMPNTSAAVGLSATAICTEPGTDTRCLDLAEELFLAVGSVVRVDEGFMDAVTALSGSGPAYVYSMAEAMEQGGIAAGLDAATARELTKQTLLGAAQMLISQEQPPEELRRRVSSPGGTTMAGLQVLQDANLNQIMQQAILSAARRSRALAAQAAADSD